MPRIQTGIDYDKVDAAAGQYAGPTPPAGVYRLRATKATITKNQSKDWMWTIYFQIAHDDESGRAKYNGALVSWTNNINVKGAPYMKQFIEASGRPAKAFGAPVTEGVDGNVPKIGGKPISEIIVKAGVYRDRWKGETRLKVRSFFEDDGEYDEVDLVDDDESEEDEYEDYDEDADDDADDDADYDDDDADDDEGDDESDDDDDSDEDEDEEGDDEDEPEPPRRGRPRKAAPAAKRAPAKAATKRAPAKAARPAAKKAPAKAAGRKRPW